MNNPEQQIIACLLISCIGLLILAYFLPKLDPPLVRVGDIGPMQLERKVRVKGDIVRSHRFSGGSYSLTLEENGSSIPVYIPYNLVPSFLAMESMNDVSIKGTVELYRGSLEIVADNIGER